ncbi:MAG: hypothetical protein QNJ74_12165 [Trichodesmium sp. MO_231.B1]|nr:hypothetical protein [Trichodesmium sp. MO_231.B1]
MFVKIIGKLQNILCLLTLLPTPYSQGDVAILLINGITDKQFKKLREKAQIIAENQKSEI